MAGIQTNSLIYIKVKKKKSWFPLKTFKKDAGKFQFGRRHPDQGHGKIVFERGNRKLKYGDRGTGFCRWIFYHSCVQAKSHYFSSWEFLGLQVQAKRCTCIPKTVFRIKSGFHQISTGGSGSGIGFGIWIWIWIHAGKNDLQKKKKVKKFHFLKCWMFSFC